MDADRFSPEPFATFTEALLDPERPVPPDLVRGGGGSLARRFAIHRTGVRRVWREALAARFPVSLRLVGDEFFAAAADLFLTALPPLSPVVSDYGAEFPAFLSTFAPLADLPLVADVARLEWAIAEATGAAEAAALSLSALAGCRPETLAGARITLHPSVRLVTTDTPALSVWQAHQTEGEPEATPGWTTERAFVLRAGDGIRLIALGAGEAAFLAALAHGATIEAAAEAGCGDAEFSAGAALGALFTRGAVTALHV